MASTQTTPQIDFELWTEELRYGGEAAYNKVYQYFYPILISHAYRMLLHEEDARDVVQELFIQLHLKKEALPHRTHLAKYLYVSLRNRVISLIRKNATYTGHLDHFKDFVQTHSYNALEILYEKDLDKIIRQEIDRLPPRMKEIFELNRFEHLSYQEIAEKLQISKQTVKNQLSSTLRLLRSKLPMYVYLILFLQMLLKRFFN